jgi:hypothetical protein
MAIGPVQLIVLGFNHPNFHGEVIEELERLRESDTVRVIDALAVHKDAEGEIEVAHLSNLTKDEAVELGSKVGALIGLGIEGEEGLECPGGHPQRLGRRAPPARASLGGPAPRRDRPGRGLPAQRRVHQPAGSGRDRADGGRGGQGPARHGDGRSSNQTMTATITRPER